MNMFGESNIDFVGRRGIAAVISLALILVGLASLVVKNGPAYSIDFTGGSLLQIQFAEPVPVDVVRAKLQEVGYSAAQIQRFGEPNELLIRIPDTGDDEAIETVKESLRESWPDLELRREEVVGPKIGGELRVAALEAIVFALVLILVYITIRFEFRFAVAAIVALVHDVLITLGAFSLMGHEISLAVIAAFLTIVGYSLNDTIVVFDRIRENLRVPARTAHDIILNRSVNQSLSRTIITSGTTILVVMILLVFGGEVLRDFALALVIGIVVGTYSSIFIATPVLVEWQKRWPRKVK
jgi:preprotein translocase subunit SecF